MQERRENFLQHLYDYLNDPQNAYLGRVTIINPNLPGMDTGIRNVSIPLDDMTGYSREKLLSAIQHELRTVQDKFPGKLVHIGFFNQTTDGQGPAPGGDGTYPDELWQWLYRDASDYTDADGIQLVSLFDEFNGIKRPRVSFFQENIGAARTSNPPPIPTPTPTPSSNAPNYITPQGTTSYTFTPPSSKTPSFGYYAIATEDSYNNGITLQANTAWTNPFTNDGRGERLRITINGSPNDALEAAFNTYLCQYLEAYLADIDRAELQDSNAEPDLNAVLWAGELQSWHDYFFTRDALAPIEGPAGPTVERTASNNNLITWFAVYRADTYTVQRQDLGTPSAPWTDAPGCNHITATQCTDPASTGSQYAYKVKASNNDHDSAWSCVAVFLSENDNDGYVEKTGMTRTPKNGEPQPGIRAGEGIMIGTMTPHWRGVLSFNTGALGSAAKILSAKLRLKQATDGTHFAQLGDCMVDIINGSFSGNPALEPNDYNSAGTTADAFHITDVGLDNWFESELIPSAAMTNVSNTDKTQFRIYFSQANIANRSEGWYSGETASSTPSSPPQLIVRYAE